MNYLLYIALAGFWPALASIAEEKPALVSATDFSSSVALDIRYRGENNFVGETIDGYLAPKCLLSREAAKALAKAARLAKQKRLRLKIFDCYRPQTSVDHFVRWAKDLDDERKKETYYPNVAKSELFRKGYIALKSGHSRASTVDLTLTDPAGEELDMGTVFDFFDPLSHTENPRAGKTALKNRRLLKGIMLEAGFTNYAKEWWHYTLKNEPYPNTYFSRPVR